MKKLVIALFALFTSVAIQAQIGGCSNGINSVEFSPIPGTNDISVSIESRCCEVHSLTYSQYSDTTPNPILSVCYLDTGLLMPTTITSTIVLPNANAAVGDQNFTMNSYYYFGGSGTCASAAPFNAPLTFLVTTPLLEPRMFLSTENNFNIKKASLYPNPNSGTFSIELPTDTNQVQLSISDLSGKEVYYTAAYSSGDMLHLQGLSKGVYFAKVVNNQTSETLKFIVD